jgi:formylglycine-generating enzyme required for sulfatase activity
MVVIPAGQFMMGAAPGEEELENLSDEFRHRSEPQHQVKVRRFAVGKYEVTRREFRVFAEETGRGTAGCFFWNGEDWQMDVARSWRKPGYAQGDTHPVACVSWEDATAYAAWLSAKTGQRYRLLTEAEWEYAARGGTMTARYWGDDGDALCTYANGGDRTALREAPGAINWPLANCDDGHAYTAPVGTYRANAYGLHDMLGNVWEWTQDCWNTNYRGAPVDGSAWSAGDCYMRVVRGGSWDDVPMALRAAYRVGSPVVVRVYGRGFRVAKTIEPDS